MGVAAGLQIPPMAAGAIVSGATSETSYRLFQTRPTWHQQLPVQNFFEHMRHMLYTTLPALGICLIVFTLLGLNGFEGARGWDQVEPSLKPLRVNFTRAAGYCYHLSGHPHGHDEMASPAGFDDRHPGWWDPGHPDPRGRSGERIA